MVNFYAVLEVSRDASQEEIKRSYHRLALKYHPDKAGPESAAKFKEINTAYEVLSDPQKKITYDTYGEAGLDAMENPVAGGAMAALGPTVSILILLVLLFLIMAMILIFLAFLVSFVGGHLSSWNYVKVFAPLFVIDILVGVPVIILFFVFLTTTPKAVPIHCIFLAVLCAIVLTVVIPIAKDRNEARAQQGRTDFLKWRVWLIPGYLLSVFVFLAVFFIALPTPHRVLKLKSMGLVRLANYLPVGFVIAVLEAACVVIFFALIACRADGKITTNYFIIIGLPIFVCLTLFLINRLVFGVLEFYVSDVPPEVLAAAQAAEEAANGEEPRTGTTMHPAPEADGNNSSSNPMRGGGAAAGEEEHNERYADGADENHYSTDFSHRSNPGNNNNTTNENDHNDENDNPFKAGEQKNPYAGQHGSCCGIVVNMLLASLVVGMLMASTAMIAVRLNYYHNYGTYIGVLSLAKACIPLFILVGAAVLALVVGCFLVGCGVATIVADVPAPRENGDSNEGGNQQEAEEEEMQENNNNKKDKNSNNSAGPASAEDAPNVPHQDATTTGRPTEQRAASQESGTTPPERQPDNEHLSDID